MLKRRQAGEKAAFIPFVVAGDPSIEATEQVIEILIEEGADLIELGVPFSDAMADGPVIQAASERAAARVSLEEVLRLASHTLKKHPGFPFVLFTYFNPIFRMGLDAFAKRAAAAGIHAVLIVDFPPEEAKQYLKVMAEHGVKTVFLASPTTSPERLKWIAQASTAFIYYVSRIGVTGVQAEVSQTLGAELRRMRELTEQPIAVGFGIATGAHAAEVACLADAVVVGSAFVRILANDAGLSAALPQVRDLAREIKQAIGK